MKVSERLDELAREAGDVNVKGGQYSRSGRLFAVADDSTAELKLRTDIAEAAVQTPGASGSTRGNDWVRLDPADWDDHARDRLDAWFRVAWRFAGDKD